MKSGIFTIPRHSPTEIGQFIAQFKPSLVLFWLHVVSAQQIQGWRISSPNTIFVACDGGIADNADKNTMAFDLHAKAVEHATSFARSRDLGFGPLYMDFNESPIWNGHDYRVKYADYNCVLLEECHARGIDSVIFNFSTSWPQASIDEDNWWPTFKPAVDAMGPRDYIGLHEYWPTIGPLHLSWYPWTAGKHRLCPYNKPILITECGLDQAVAEGGTNRGYLLFMTPDKYVTQLQQYHSTLDPRVKGTAIFLADYENNMWESFDIRHLISQNAFSGTGWESPNPMAMPYKIGLPLTQPVRITQLFGANPVYYAQFGLAGHGGIDFSVVTGTPILAVADGKVTRVRKDTTGYGWHVMVNHGWGQSISAHMSRIDVVEQQEVMTGKILGLSGNTGNSTGPHLHFGIRIYGQPNPTFNDWVDPYPYFSIGGNPVEDAIIAKAHQVVIPLNPDAAFEIAGAAKGFLPASPEFDVMVGDFLYRAQAYRSPTDRAYIHLVYCIVPRWNALTWTKTSN